MLRAVGQNLTPLERVNTILLNDGVDHVVKMVSQLSVEPLVRADISHAVGATVEVRVDERGPLHRQELLHLALVRS